MIKGRWHGKNQGPRSRDTKVDKIARTPIPKEDFYGQLLPSRKFPIHLWSSASYMENQSKMYNKKKNNRLKS